MNNILKILALFVFTSSSLYRCSQFYTANNVDNIFICCNQKLKIAFIGSVDYSIVDSNNVILPSEYDGCTINKLGGYYGRGVPTPFGVNLIDLPEVQLKDEYYSEFTTSEKYIYEENSHLWSDYEIHNVPMNITLPDKLEEIDSTFGKEILVRILPNGTRLGFAEIWRVVYHFSINENNSHFYTIDGKLYNKETNNLIDVFIYE